MHLQAWVKEKTPLLQSRVVIESTQSALFELSEQDAFQRDFDALLATSAASLSALANTVTTRKYTGLTTSVYAAAADVVKLSASIEAHWPVLRQFAVDRFAFLQDSLARNTHIDKVAVAWFIFYSCFFIHSCRTDQALRWLPLRYLQQACYVV